MDIMPVLAPRYLSSAAKDRIVDHEAENSDAYMDLAWNGNSLLNICGKVKTI
jgi:hypothetical protein